ncbi:aminoglycoside adenylyltransferase [Kurthia sp. 3B1D]|uniref:Aminoglycoside N(6')-acetyltransferase type 1 n=1 Tax=Candidatus Kurthia intestinigallinarum TaxID=1562256 RepID=A0A433RQ21_9BACL|nr:aminoglycoside 6'-N-acetyltransferase [Kurthia sp. 3B1D]RUS52434.1 aminoglycoside adenylyltransferase [Kurthia sp. 3B1D]
MIRQAEKNEAMRVAELALLLWPNNDLAAFTKEFKTWIEDDEALILLALDQDYAVGFAQCQLRHEYVEGTDSSPVGYLEGLYVKQAYRMKGIANELVKSCELWAKDKKCREFASDCELSNDASIRMHKKLGFTEANRIVCFTKTLC